MLVRVLVLLVVLSMPLQARAASWVVHPGDTLGSIAVRYHVSIPFLARLNGISNFDLVRIGQVLRVPDIRRTYAYRVRWGDTLLGVAARAGLSVSQIRAMNPRLGPYLLAGQVLTLCGPCGGSTTAEAPGAGVVGSSSSLSGRVYRVLPGDTLSGIAARFNVTSAALISANQLGNPDRIIIGTLLTVPAAAAAVGAYDPWGVRSLIVSYATRYGMEASFPLAIAWQESGFNQNLVSSTGAIGVMQVEPYTEDHINYLLGRSFNLYSVDDNIHAGVYWLSQLLAYYGGDERMAAAAYYQGTRSIAQRGFFLDTVQYVNDVMALKSSFGG